MKTRIVLLLLLASCCLAPALHGQPSALAWPEVTRQHKPWTRWWWMGSAVDKPSLTHLLQTYQQAGLGGVEITPIYGVKGMEDHFVDFLSPTWMDLLAHTLAEAERLDLGVDMATGTGWPFGGPQVKLRDAATRAIVQTYPLATGERLAVSVAYRDEKVDRAAPLQALVAASTTGDIEDLTERVDENGRLDWTAPEGAWTLYAFFQGWTGQQVKRAAPGGEGLVPDHYARQALDHYLARFDDAFAAHQSPRVRAYFNDSYEVYDADWTPHLLEEFARRKGYDLRSYLPALADDGREEVVARVKSDYRETISDLLLERFTVPWTDWAHRQGSFTRNQAHGSPGNLLDLYAATDIPETETFGPPGNPDNDPLISKFASSAAHVAGKPLSSSESATWLGEHFTVSLEQLKGVVDQLFVSGINHVFYHGTVYSPPEAPWPGWLFYASTQVNPANPIWLDLPTLNRYIARCQSILQAGGPANDILLYWPVYDPWHDPAGLRMDFRVHRPDWFYDQPFGQLAQTLWDRGYTFDYVSDRLLAPVTLTGGGAIETAGTAYKVIVVPETDHMPLATLEKLLNLAHAGATVLFQRQLPADVPGLHRLAERRERLATMKRLLPFEATSVDGLLQAALGQGRLLLGDDLSVMLPHAGVQREGMTDHKGVQFVRRRHAQGYHYFIRHAGETALDGWIGLAVPAASATLLDPLTGRTGLAWLRTNTAGRAEIYLQLPPGASVILRTFDQGTEGNPWPYRHPEGPPAAMTGSWEVTFIEGGPTLPASFRTDRLASWTALGDENARRFAGTARYTIRFDAPGTAETYLLDLGEVAHSARVWLNGRALGTLIAHPFQVETGALNPKGNLLEIEVTNLAANRIRDLDQRGVAWRVFYDINFVNIDYEAFDASTWPLRPSGLLGPVRLHPLQVH